MVGGFLARARQRLKRCYPKVLLNVKMLLCDYNLLEIYWTTGTHIDKFIVLVFGLRSGDSCAPSWVADGGKRYPSSNVDNIFSMKFLNKEIDPISAHNVTRNLITSYNLK